MGKLKNKLGILILLSVFAVCAVQIVTRALKGSNTSSSVKKTKLYWFIPDGLRAEPDVFHIYQWAQEGKLPNIKKMMEAGTYGYSVPVFPGHTPSNFATLFTGLLPKDHGVADGPLRSHGYPLKIVSRSGFSSTAKLKDPIWYTLEKLGLVSSLLSVPGSTPPETSTGKIVRGRWGGWGVEFPSIVVHSSEDEKFQQLIGKNDRTFNIGKKLTHFLPAVAPQGWGFVLPKSFSPLREITVKNWDAEVYFLLIDDVDDGTSVYTKALVSPDKKSTTAVLAPGEWTPWFKKDLFYPIQKSYQDEAPQKMDWEQKITGLNMPVQMRIGAIQLGSTKEFRFRVLYDALNESLTFPAPLAAELQAESGPMVDFPDDFPPQLIYVDNDKKTFLDESKFSFDWHEKTLGYIFRKSEQDVIIHNIYTPNQMLTSRWWMGYADPKSKKYGEVSEDERAVVWSEVLALYKRIDDMLGLAIANLDKDAYLVFSSDHGIAPLNVEVRLNNLFAKKGWLKFHKESDTSALTVDWKKTRVVFLQSNHVYINTKNLDAAYYPENGEAAKVFVAEVQAYLSSLEIDGVRPFAHVYQRAEAAEKLGLPANLIGDIVLAHELGYCAVEDMTMDGLGFSRPLKSGYKQGLNPSENRSLWTPFMVMGPGVKQGFALTEPISHLDQYPTIMKLLGEKTELTIKSGELSGALEL